jgi:hypothetical protein
MSLPYSSAAAALLALTQTLTLSAAQENDLREHDLPRLCLDVPNAIFLVTLGGTHLLVSASPESQKILTYHLAHHATAYLLDEGQFHQATPAQAQAYFSRLPPVYVIEAQPNRRTLTLRALSGNPTPIFLGENDPLYRQAQHLLKTRPRFARDAGDHRVHVQHQHRVVALYEQLAQQPPPAPTGNPNSDWQPTVRSVYPKSWGAKQYPVDVDYVLTHMSERGKSTLLFEAADVQATFDAIRHDPLTRQLLTDTSTEFTLLGRCTVKTGTSWPDALAQLTARVPAPYRLLPASVVLQDAKGKRLFHFPY